MVRPVEMNTWRLDDSLSSMEECRTQCLFHRWLTWLLAMSCNGQHQHSTAWCLLMQDHMSLVQHLVPSWTVHPFLI